MRWIRFQGNGSALGATSDYAMRAPMEQRASPPFTWLLPARARVLRRDELALDALRIETWLAHQGYFDARFLGWQVVELRGPTRRRGAVVGLVGAVERGRATSIRSVEVEGLGPAARPLWALIQQEAEVERGDRFTLDQLDALEQQALLVLREQTYAHAQVQVEAQVEPELQAADLRVRVESGPSSVFGPIRLQGNKTVPSAWILDELEVREGEPFHLSAIRRSQQRLFGLGVFSVVQLVPEPVRDEQGELLPMVPLRVEVAETTARQFRLGGGLSVESARQEVDLGMSFEHANFAQRLWRLRVGAEGGYASLLTWSEAAALGWAGLVDKGAPVLALEASLQIPRVAGPRLRLETDLLFDLGVEPEYRFASPSGSAALAARLSRKLSARAGYRVRYFDYFDSTLPADADLLDRRSQRLGLDFRDPYLLSAAFQQLSYDSRDDAVYPRRGSLSYLDLSEAGGPLGGQYTFVKVLADGRLWRPLPTLLGWRQRLTFTARLAGGVALPIGAGERAQVPFAERIMVGGSTSVRGWGRHHLGPYLYTDAEGQVRSSAVGEEQPVDDPDREDDDILYIGGRAALFGGTELRGYWARGPLRNVGLAAFLDFGRAWDGAGVSGLADLRARVLQISTSVGGGLRYRSPIGPLRLDFARRNDHFAMFSQEPRWMLHLGLAEAW